MEVISSYLLDAAKYAFVNKSLSNLPVSSVNCFFTNSDVLYSSGDNS
jgi:hypothetical protein